MPKTYDKFLKLAVGWGGESDSTHNNNSDAGVAMVQPGRPGRGDQGGRGRGGRYGQGGGPGCGRGGGGRGSQKQIQKPQQPQQNPADKQVQPEAKKGPPGGCFHCQGNHYICECPELASNQKAQLFIQTQDGYHDINVGDDDNYDVNGEYHDFVCGINVYKPPHDVELVGCLVILGQNQSGHARPTREKLD